MLPRFPTLAMLNKLPKLRDLAPPPPARAAGLRPSPKRFDPYMQIPLRARHLFP
jgi:hypothetical protein